MSPVFSFREKMSITSGQRLLYLLGNPLASFFLCTRSYFYVLLCPSRCLLLDCLTLLFTLFFSWCCLILTFTFRLRLHFLVWLLGGKRDCCCVVLPQRSCWSSSCLSGCAVDRCYMWCRSFRVQPSCSFVHFVSACGFVAPIRSCCLSWLWAAP